MLRYREENKLFHYRPVVEDLIAAVVATLLFLLSLAAGRSAGHAWGKSSLHRMTLRIACLTALIIATVAGSDDVFATSGVISIPQTGQTTCYDAVGTAINCAGTGQDGDIQAGAVWPTPRFTNNYDGTIKDNLTNLTWLKDGNDMGTRNPGRDGGVYGTRNDDPPNVGNVMWEAAANYPSYISGYAGYSDWRLPNINELTSLVNYGQSSTTWLASNGFVNTGYAYWSSTISRPSNTTSTDANAGSFSGYTWSALVPGGYMGTSYLYVMPVRGGLSGNFSSSVDNAVAKTGQTSCWTTYGAHSNTTISCSGSGQDGASQMGVGVTGSRFSDNNDGTIADNLTGLVWSKDAKLPGPSVCSPGVAKSWQNQLEYVKCLNMNSYLGKTDWRLPNIMELKSLVNKEQDSNATWLAGFGFTNIGAGYYTLASSTTDISQKDKAWYLEMRGGYSSSTSKSQLEYAWPVRGGTRSSVSYPLAVTKTLGGNSVGNVTADTGSFFWSGNSGETSYLAGTVVTLSATVNTVSEFVGWSGACTGTGTCQVTMDMARSVTATFVPDTTPPDTTITAQPANLTKSTSASFSFTSSESNSTFQCQLNSIGYSNCTSPKSYSGLPDGNHTFAVRATDSAGNTDATPANFAWTIDTTAPALSINSPSLTTTRNTDVTYAVTYTNADSVTLTDSNVTLNRTGTANGTINVTGSGTATRTVTISGISGDGTLGISIAAGTAVDVAGNAAAASIASATFLVDSTVSQSVSFGTPPSLVVGGTATVTAVASSGLAVTFSTTTSSVCSINGSTVTGISPGTCTIAANQSGNANYKAATQVTQNISVGITVPSAPNNIAATYGNSQASVAFTAPLSTGGSPITSYTVTASPGGQIATGSGSPLVVSGLSNGTSYRFSVTATNSAGTGPSSLSSNAVTPFGIPGAPTNVSATLISGQANVSFTPPTSNGGSGITGYTVTASPGGQTGTGYGSPITVTGLANGTSYTFTATATNAAGQGPASSPSNAIVPVGAPGAPTSAYATAGNGQATIAFSAPTSTGGTSITGYTVTASPGGQTAPGSSSPITVSGLTNGTSYTFTVTATNSVGTSSVSSTSNAVTPKGTPSAPTSTYATAGNAQATVSFSTPSNNGGASISYYTLTASPGGQYITGYGSPMTITGLTNGTSYTFTVTATNSVGASPSSSASNAVTPIGVSAAPTNVSATAGNAQAIVSFTPPTNTGGANISYYTVTAFPGGQSMIAYGSPVTFTGLTNGTSYSFSIAATNSAGTSASSYSSSYITPAAPIGAPGAPSGLYAYAGNAQATVSFYAPASNGGATINSYTVTASPGGQSNSASSSPINVTGLTNGTSYTFTVTASNSAGMGAASAASNAVTPIGVSAAPTNVSATAGNAQAIISFTPPTNTGGANISYYTVTAFPGGQSMTGYGSPITVSGLANGTSYTFTVTAANSAGTSTSSAASSSVTPAQPVTSISLTQSTLTIGASTTISPYPQTASLGTCTSSNPTVATVSGSTVLGIATGTSQITCSNVSTTVSVQPPVLTSIALAQSPLVVGNSTLISPTPQAALLGTCTSSNPSVATINGSSVVAVAAGTSTITCTGVSTPVTVTLPTLTSISLTSATIYAATTTTILPTPTTAILGTCLSSNSTIASVAGSLVTGVAAGTATISCGNSSTSLTVQPPLLTGISLGNSSIAKATSTTILPTPTAAVLTTCTSSNSAIASVNGTTVLGVATGSATITCGNYSATVTVTPQLLMGISLSQASITVGNTTTILPNPTGAGLGTCSSTNSAIATVSGDTVTATGIGAVTIQCGSITTALTATAPPLTGITLASSSLSAGTTTTINPLPALASLGTCSSSNLSVATVSGARITAVAIGSAVINCGSASAALTVTAAAAVLTDVLINCPNQVIGGQTGSCSARAVYSNDTTKIVQAQWSSDSTALTIDSNGNLTATYVSANVTANVTASYTEGKVSLRRQDSVQVTATAQGACTGTKPYTMLLTINGQLATTPVTLKASDPVEVDLCLANFDGLTLLDVYVALAVAGPNGAPPSWFVASQSSGLLANIQWYPWDLTAEPVKFVAKQAIRNMNTVQIAKFNIPPNLAAGVTSFHVQAVFAGKRLTDTSSWSNVWALGSASFNYQP